MQATSLPPDWLREYAVWHQEHRRDADAKFIMYSCHASMNSLVALPRGGYRMTGPTCGGHGYRFKQIAWTLRVAAANLRVLLVDWAAPERLEDYM